MKYDRNLYQAIRQRLGMNGDILIQDIQAKKEHAINEKQQLTISNHHWNPLTDVRLLSLGKLINLYDRTQFGLHILGMMLDDDWYQANMENETQQDPGYRKILILEFERSLKHGFGFSLFTLIESSFRIFLRSVDPVVCKGATTSFDSIYKSLLGSKQLDLPTADKQNALELLDFVRLIRNTIHNDGVYFDQSGNNKTADYRGKEHQFNNAKPVDFVTWDLLLPLSGDIQQLLVQVITHPRVFTLKQVDDPFMSYYS